MICLGHKAKINEEGALRRLRLSWQMTHMSIMGCIDYQILLVHYRFVKYFKLFLLC
jgi:hypothetical protein